jgi:hypothetical protein
MRAREGVPNGMRMRSKTGPQPIGAAGSFLGGVSRSTEILAKAPDMFNSIGRSLREFTHK